MPRVTFAPINRYATATQVAGYYGDSRDTTSTFNYLSYSRTGYRTSVNTVGFHNPKRVGKLLPNNFQYRETTNWYNTGHISRFSKGYIDGTAKPGESGYYHYTYDGPMDTMLAGYGNADTTAPSDLDGQCRNELLNKIKDQKANLPELLAERDKCADMVGKAAMAVYDGIRHLRKGDIVGAAGAFGVPVGRRARRGFKRSFSRDSAQAVSNGWLALQYGWKPLISDIYGSLEVLASKYEAPDYHTVTARNRRKTPWSRLNSVVPSSGSRKTVNTYSGELRTTVKYSVTYYRVPSPPNSLAALGVTNPVLLGWELLPYSFVVDWFLPVGNYLSSFDATLGLSFHSGFRTLFSKSQLNMVQEISGANSSGQYQFSTTREMIQDVFVDRTVLNTFPTASFPSFKDGTSVMHMLNAIALLSQLFRK